jgi:glutathione S-transferase
MLTLYHAPWTRSTGVRILLEELQTSYELRVLNRTLGEQRSEAYLRVNPLGKVPAIDHDGAIVTEQVAIYTYLADAFPEGGLAPPIGDPLRGPYLRWLGIYGSAFEPAIIDHYLKREPGPAAMSPYGSYDALIELIRAQLAPGPHLFGERFYAADVLWGTALTWMTHFKLVPELPEFTAYTARVNARPAFQNVNAEDAALAKSHHPPDTNA